VIELPELLLGDVAEWRDWLEDFHNECQGGWLVLHKKGGTATALTYDQALDEALCFGWVDGQIGKRDEHSYRQRFTPRRPASRWSARNVGHATRLIESQSMRPAGLAAVDAAKADGRWESAYEGQSSSKVPPDLAAALAANSAAKAMFGQISSANRYAIIYRLNAVKRAETRRRKLSQFVDMLARGEVLHPQR
jgi:uncharacterized protein YdeI (YjbR/CyaY-like superfamily)